MRRIIFIVLTLLSPGLNAQEIANPGVVTEWGIGGQVDINIPGNWKRIDTGEETVLGYGGRLGGGLTLRWPKGWLLETMLTIGYDRLELPTGDGDRMKCSLDRWGISLPVTGGYLFDVTEEMQIGPMSGVDFSYSLSDRLHSSSTSSKMTGGEWEPFNISWGFGCGMRFGRYGVDVRGWFGLLNLLKRNPLNLPSPCYPNGVRIGMKYYL